MHQPRHRIHRPQRYNLGIRTQHQYDRNNHCRNKNTKHRTEPMARKACTPATVRQRIATTLSAVTVINHSGEVTQVHNRQLLGPRDSRSFCQSPDNSDATSCRPKCAHIMARRYTGTTERRNNRHHHGRNQPKLAIPAGFRYLSITGVHDSPHLMPLSPSSMMLV